MQTFIVLIHINQFHNTGSHKFLSNLFYSFYRISWCILLLLFKFSKTLNWIFSEVITYDFTCIFMMKITKSNWKFGIIFCYMSWYILFWSEKKFPYKIWFISTVIYHMFCNLQIRYRCDTIFMVALIDSNPLIGALVCTFPSFLDNTNFARNSPYYIWYDLFHSWVLEEVVSLFLYQNIYSHQH